MDSPAKTPRTNITLCGLRAMVQQMLKDAADGRWDLCKAIAFTADGHAVALTLNVCGSMVELCACWRPDSETSVHPLDEDLVETDPFFAAVSRHLGQFGTRMNLAVMDTECKDLKSKDDALPGALERIQRLLDLEMCDCGRMVKPSERLVCNTCILECGEEDVAKHVCGVCKELAVAPIEKTKCCDQHIHSVCLDKCIGVSDKCPFCRAAFFGEVVRELGDVDM